MKKSELIQRKFIQQYNVSDYEILTDTGWQDIKSVSKTIPYERWTIETQSGKKLSGADNHIVFRDTFQEVFLCELKVGDKILTQDGSEKVIFVHDDGYQENMYDIQVNSADHRFFSNGILSHNSTSYSIYVLWYILINHDKSVLICANRLKTATQILGRIKMAYEELPNWLKPGIVKWNSGSIEFSNGCKVSAEATSESSGRGMSINCIAGNQRVTILADNKVYYIPLRIAYQYFSVDLIQNKTDSDIIINLADREDIEDLSVYEVRTQKTDLDQTFPYILTDTGWSKFSGIVRYTDRDIIEITVNDKKIRCTKDHKIYINNEIKFAKELPYIELGKQTVYDVLNVQKNNRFYINQNILVHNCLLLDEFAFIAPNMEEQFMQSVFPVISSSKTSKIIIVSTPNGVDNEYYRIWSKAELNTDPDDLNAWHAEKINWWDVPGRDENWKNQQLAKFNHDQTRFNQEYGNCVLGDTQITIFDTELHQEIQIPIRELQNLIPIKFQTHYLIKTPQGFKSFTGISKKEKQCFRIYFNDKTSIGCSKDHPFIYENQIIRAYDLSIGQSLLKDKNLVTIVKIEDIGNQLCYDVLDVKDIHAYYTNGLISHNSFLGSAQTLLNTETIEKFKALLQDKTKLKKSYTIALHPDYPELMINMYVPPQKGRAYIIGADPATGTQSDFHAMTVWDITNLYKIELVADFYSNNLPPKYFAYILAKTGTLYNNAYIAIENNGVSYATVDKLCNDFEYENVIHDGGNKMDLAISSSDDKKLEACIHLKQFIEDPLRSVLIYNPKLIDEMQKFEKKSKPGKLPKYACFSGHDDLMMTLLWAFYYLKPISLDNYYNVIKYGTDKLNNEVPLIVSSVESPNANELHTAMNQIDKIFNTTAKSYELEMQDLQKSVEKSQEELMQNFLDSHVLSGTQSKPNVDPDTGEQLFQFDGFIV